jgi:neuronal calcium sensor 1
MGNCVGGKGPKKDPKLLTEEEIKILLSNTKLTRPQIIALHQNFLKECPTGKLTKKDFIKLFKEVHPSDNKKEKADKFCEYVFKVIDYQNLGYISFQEFVLCFSLTSDGDFKDKCDFAFKLYDLDKDDKISKKEMTQVLTALYDLSGITDRKGDKSPAKKVEDIMKKLNTPAAQQQQEAAQTSSAAAAAGAKEKSPTKEKKSSGGKDSKASSPSKDAGAKDSKKDAKKDATKKDAKKETKKDTKEKPAKEKPAKPVKEKPAKIQEFITKQQFIDACSNDESIRSLLIDSIFAPNDASSTSVNNNNNNNSNTINIGGIGSASFTPPSVNVRTLAPAGGPQSVLVDAAIPNPSIDFNNVVSTSTTFDRGTHKITTSSEVITISNEPHTISINNTIDDNLRSLNSQIDTASAQANAAANQTVNNINETIDDANKQINQAVNATADSVNSAFNQASGELNNFAANVSDNVNNLANTRVEVSANNNNNEYQNSDAGISLNINNEKKN